MFVSGAYKSALKPPPPGRWSGKEKDLEVKQFLKELKCHLTWYKVSEAGMGATALNFLTDKPFKMWASQLEDFEAPRYSVSAMRLQQVHVNQKVFVTVVIRPLAYQMPGLSS